MTITPSEISNKDFKRNFRGYDMDEVDTFLDALREDYEKLYKTNSTLKEQIIILKEKVDHYSNMENTLQNTLVLAQTAAQQAKDNSEKEASIVLKEAEREADNLIKAAEVKIMEMNKEYEFIKQQFNVFKSRFKGMVESQLDTIEKIEDEMGFGLESFNASRKDKSINITKNEVAIGEIDYKEEITINENPKKKHNNRRDNRKRDFKKDSRDGKNPTKDDVNNSSKKAENNQNKQ